jgi:ATP-dependent helicase/DNAse subunit B
MQLLVGPPNSGKSERVISRVGEALAGRRGRVYLVVPSARAADVVRDRLAASLEAHAVGSPKQAVVTFPDLYTAILRERGIDLEWLSQVKRERLLRRVVSRLKESGQLAYFGSIYDRVGLISALAEFTDELWRSRTDPAAFARVARDGSPKDRDVALIFERYQKALAEARAIDAEGAGLMALSAIQMIPVRAERGSSPIRMVAADGFDFYTAVQVGLMSKLASLGVETIATLTCEQGRDVHLWQEPTLARFTGARAEVVACTAAPRTEIERAACDLMKDDVKRSSDDDPVVEAIQIVSAPDRAAEARFAAREVKRLVIERGYALDDIALVTRSLGQYAANLERVFAECSIPLAVDCLSPLAENPLVISLLRLLRLALDSFPRRACLDCLRSPYFDLAAFGLDQNAVDSLDRLSLNENVLGGRDQWKEAIIATGEKGRAAR